jgi:peroxiredoxin
MVATFYLLGCLLAPAQATAPPVSAPLPSGSGSRAAEWALAPHLARSQELVYRGTFTEEASGGGVQFSRSYRLESRIFVLDTPPRGADVAVLTLLKPRGGRTTGPADAGSPAAVRLEQAVVEPRGRVVAEPGTTLAVALDGPPTCECGAFVEIPEGRVSLGQGWETAEPGRPVRLWRVAATEMVNGASCVKLAGLQQSDDWDRPRGDRTAWRRFDTVWVSPRTGLASRVERVIERRDPGRRDPTLRLTLRYELESSLQYPGQLHDDRLQEIRLAVTTARSAGPFLAAPARAGPQLAALLSRIDYHLERQPPTPYRDALLQVKRQVEAARRGEAVVRVAVESAAPTTGAEPGQLAPDFIVPYLTHTGASFQLHRCLGRPILLVFYNPASRTSPDLLRFAQEIAALKDQPIAVIGLSVDADAGRVRAQWTDMGLSFAVLNGTGLRKSYAVETTPKLIVLDAAGVVRGAYLGWGHETPVQVRRDLKQCQKK